MIHISAFFFFLSFLIGLKDEKQHDVPGKKLHHAVGENNSGFIFFLALGC